MNSYSRIRSAIFAQPWAILPSSLETILVYLSARADGNVVLSEDETAILEAAQRQHRMTSADGVAVIPITGTIAHRMGSMQAMSGGATTRQIAADTRAAVADPNVRGIVHYIHSPGGTVDGVPELAEEIRSMRGQKPIVAVADTMAASAAYWIASAADEIVVTPSGQVGSIGVFAVHEDFSEQYAALGEKRTLIASSKWKGEGMDFAPLTDDLREHIEEQVLAYDDMFVSAVAKGRGVTESVVRNSFGQGRMVMAKQAVKAGMADRVGGLNDTIERLMSKRSKIGQRRVENPSIDVDVSANDIQLQAVRAQLEHMEAASEGVAEKAAWVAELDEAEADEPAHAETDFEIEAVEPTPADEQSPWRAANKRRRLQLRGRGPDRTAEVRRH